jgi:hypothetical protein
MHFSKNIFIITLVTGFGVLFWFYSEKGSAQVLFEDFDQDGLSNEEEAVLGTDPYKSDTDGDGYGDYTEVMGGYDPLKPAPGDKILVEGGTAEQEGVSSREGEFGSEDGEQELLTATEKAAVELSTLAEDATMNGEEVTLDSVKDVVQEILEETNKPVELPEVDRENIKILEQDYDDLGEEERKVREKEDMSQYLSALAYIFATSSPKKIDFQSQEEARNIIMSEITNIIGGFYREDNYGVVQEWSDRGRKILEEMQEIEVPESMLDIHIKGLQIALYAISLEDQVKPNSEDPIGNITSLSQAQSLLILAMEYQSEVEQAMKDIDIEDLDISL